MRQDGKKHGNRHMQKKRVSGGKWHVIRQPSRMVESIRVMDNKMVKGSFLNPNFICTCTFILYT